MKNLPARLHPGIQHWNVGQAANLFSGNDVRERASGVLPAVKSQLLPFLRFLYQCAAEPETVCQSRDLLLAGILMRELAGLNPSCLLFFRHFRIPSNRSLFLWQRVYSQSPATQFIVLFGNSLSIVLGGNRIVLGNVAGFFL